jgi:hypothetical protein
MGTPGNGDGWADSGGGYDDLPDLPPEWGSIVIPDDPSDLAAEAALVRRELRHQRRRAGWRRRLGLAPGTGGSARAPLRLPLLIMAVAVLATLTSLFAVVWPNQQRQFAVPRAGTSSSGSTGRALPDLNVVDENGALVPLRSLLPAVIILIDDCTCADQVRAALRAVPPGVRVVTLSSHRPSPGPATPPTPGGTDPIRALVDPTGRVRDSLRTTPKPGTAPAMLAARSGGLVRILAGGNSVADYPAELSQLANR